MFRFIIIYVLIICRVSFCFAAPVEDSDSLSRKLKNRQMFVYSTGVAGYFGSLYLLNDLWYKDYPRSSFHFFNDNGEWLQMDKIGHAATAYHVSLWGTDVMRWAGLGRKKAIWIGGLAGPFYMTTIEILDGFSAGWGASPGDLMANTFGSFLSVSQQLLWDEQKMLLKWSFHKSDYAKYRPDLLGSNFMERSLKDYNGQTYWLSMNLKSVVNSDRIPSWLNLALGYSAEGMTGAFNNSSFYKETPIPQFNRKREFLFSLDVDFKRIKTKSKFLKGVFNAFGFLKIPAPSLIYSDKSLHFSPIYF